MLPLALWYPVRDTHLSSSLGAICNGEMTTTKRISLEVTHDEDLNMCIFRHVILYASYRRVPKLEARQIPYPRNSSLRHRGLLSAKPRLDTSKVKGTTSLQHRRTRPSRPQPPIHEPKKLPYQHLSPWRTSSGRSCLYPRPPRHRQRWFPNPLIQHSLRNSASPPPPCEVRHPHTPTPSPSPSNSS